MMGRGIVIVMRDVGQELYPFIDDIHILKVTFFFIHFFFFIFFKKKIQIFIGYDRKEKQCTMDICITFNNLYFLNFP